MNSQIFNVECITSKANPTVVKISKLVNKKYRKEEELFTLDGVKLFFEAYSLFKTELDYSDRELADTFNLPLDVLTHFFARKPTLLRILRS